MFGPRTASSSPRSAWWDRYRGCTGCAWQPLPRVSAGRGRSHLCLLAKAAVTQRQLLAQSRVCPEGELKQETQLCICLTPGTDDVNWNPAMFSHVKRKNWESDCIRVCALAQCHMDVTKEQCSDHVRVCSSFILLWLWLSPTSPPVKEPGLEP